MSSQFFLKQKGKVNKKRTFEGAPQGPNKKKYQPRLSNAALAKKRPHREDEEIESDGEVDGDINSKPDLQFSTDEEDQETVQDKRLRVAKSYLTTVTDKIAEHVPIKQLHGEVEERLETEYLDQMGRLKKTIAASIKGFDADNITNLRHKAHHLPICTLAISSDEKFLFSGSKTKYVLKWNLETHKLEGSFDVQPHARDLFSDTKRRSHVIALCISTDMKFLALAEGGNNIQIWCPRELKHLKTFDGHRDIVTALVFQKQTHTLYSGSKDRAIKIWSLDEMTYVENLYGHQAGITGIDALARGRAISSGGSDCSVRLWKIAEESQLVFNGPRASIDHVKYLNDENFITGGDDGSLCLWSFLRKKPNYVQSHVHGLQSNGDAKWITALSCVVNTDLVASGSSDGYIRLWQVSQNVRKFKEILKIPMTGFINSLVFNNDGSKLYAAVGQEHRLGRWWCMKDAKNKIVIIDLVRNTTS